MDNEELYLNIINNLSDGVYIVDNDRRITFWNKAAEEITGYRAEEVVGRQCQNSRLNHIDKGGRPLCFVGCPLYATIIDGEQRKDEVFLRHKEGHRIPIMVNIFPLKKEEKIIGAIEVFTQNSPIVYEDDLVEKLSDMAMKDALTSLPNRRYMESFLDFKIKEYNQFRVPFVVLFMDIDNFSAFNNSYGHDIGDAVLRNVSKSIRRITRKTDLFSRWGGEEFVGVFAVKQIDEVMAVAEKIRVLVANTEVTHKNEQLRVTVSIGATIIQDGDSVNSIVERADKLMYESKQKGKNCVSVD